MSYKAIKTQLVEIVLQGVPAPGNQQTKIQFPDQPYLRNKKIWALEIFNVGDVPVSPSQNAVISNANMIASFLTLYLTDPDNPDSTGEWVQSVPLAVMHKIQNAASDPFNRAGFIMVGQTVSWEKCYFTLAAAFANTANLSFLLNVYHSDTMGNSKK